MKRLFYGFTVLVTITLFTNTSITAQSFSCVIDGKNYNGKVTEALQVKMGKEEFLQVKVQQGDKGIYLYLKVNKMTGTLPAKLTYTPHNYETGQSPDAEIIWVPDGPENPQWNAVEGFAEITKYDPAGKIVSGNFKFVVEKMVYGTEVKKETLDMKEGVFTDIKYIIEPPAKK